MAKNNFELWKDDNSYLQSVNIVVFYPQFKETTYLVPLKAFKHSLRHIHPIVTPV